jgi:hypothetical protein
VINFEEKGSARNIKLEATLDEDFLQNQQNYENQIFMSLEKIKT